MEGRQLRRPHLPCAALLAMLGSDVGRCCHIVRCIGEVCKKLVEGMRPIANRIERCQITFVEHDAVVRMRIRDIIAAEQLLG